MKWEGDCEFCLSYIQNCPHNALKLKSGERNPKHRYRHKEGSILDIKRANNQQ